MAKAKFNTTAEAASVMSRVHAAGQVEAWNDQRVFGKVYARFLRNGRWYDVTASDLTAWGL